MSSQIVAASQIFQGSDGSLMVNGVTVVGLKSCQVKVDINYSTIVQCGSFMEDRAPQTGKITVSWGSFVSLPTYRPMMEAARELADGQVPTFTMVVNEGGGRQVAAYGVTLDSLTLADFEAGKESTRTHSGQASRFEIL